MSAVVTAAIGKLWRIFPCKVVTIDNENLKRQENNVIIAYARDNAKL